MSPDRSPADKAFQLAMAFLAAGKLDDAAMAFADAARLRPAWWEAWARLASVHDARKDWSASIPAYERALELQPKSPQVLCNLGMAYLARRNYAEALRRFAQAAVLPPPIPEVFNGMGVACKALNRPVEAVEAFRKALSLRPADVDWLCNLGNTYAALHRFEEAHAAYDQVLKMKPGDGAARFGKSLAYLVCGQFKEGFALYESRWESELRGCKRVFGKPEWNGETPLEGKTVLVDCEQGLGDTIQFVRYVTMLVQRNARVWLEVQPSLVDLCKTIPGVTVFPEKTAPDSYDLTCSLLSLPRLLKTTLETIPSAAPYLFADLAKAAAWRERLATSAEPRIGLVPSGNPHHTNDHNRSIALETLAPIFEAFTGSLFILQKELAQPDRAFLAKRPIATHVGAEFTDFTETAAAIENLDLVISVDTSLAHLAGALGKPVFLFLPFSPDWRWLLDRADSPWYPSMQIFRQTNPGDWGPAIEAVSRELASRRSGANQEKL
jgi:tetratricopeptide (TPR) repeat protein